MTIRQEIGRFTRIGIAAAAIGTAGCVPTSEQHNQLAARVSALETGSSTPAANPTVTALEGKVRDLESRLAAQAQTNTLQDSKIANIEATYASLAGVIAAEKTKAEMTKGGQSLDGKSEGELVWGDQDEFAIIFGDKPMGNQKAHTAIQITDGKDTFHVLVPAGRVMRVPFATSSLGKGWQGAEWEVWGDLDKLVTRFREMNQEVVQRDGIAAPALLYAGSAQEAPQGFGTQLPRGWTVQEFLKGPDGSMQAPQLKWEQSQVRGQNLTIEAPNGPKVFQVWDGRNVATTKQIVVPQGGKAILNGYYEGSGWEIVGGNIDAVATRSLEMGTEWKTHDPRRGNQNLTTYFCGQGQAPQGLRVDANVCRPQ